MNNYNYEIKVLSNHKDHNADYMYSDIDIVEIDGHVYIIASRYEGGTSIIHAESCPCKNKEQKL